MQRCGIQQHQESHLLHARLLQVVMLHCSRTASLCLGRSACSQPGSPLHVPCVSVMIVMWDAVTAELVGPAHQSPSSSSTADMDNNGKCWCTIFSFQPQCGRLSFQDQNHGRKVSVVQGSAVQHLFSPESGQLAVRYRCCGRRPQAPGMGKVKDGPSSGHRPMSAKIPGGSLSPKV